MMTSEMKVRAIAPWFGGKRTMAPEIVRQLGPHTQFFEPFCGSMAVLFAKPESRHETVFDLHSDLANLAGVLRQRGLAESLYDDLQRTLVSESLLDEAEAFFRADPRECPDTGNNTKRAYWYFLSCWMARNGVAGMERNDFQLAVRWTAGGGSPTVRWRSAVESLPAWHRRLVNVVILCRDALPCIPKFDDKADTAIYCDPPYHSASRSHGSYKHDFQRLDHARLADILKGFKNARIVVSYYDCPEVRDLYQGWTFLDRSRQKNLHSMNERGTRTKEAPEILIINGPAVETVPDA